MKTCRSCGVRKPLASFNKDAARSDGHGVYCRPCNRRIHRDWRAARYGIKHPLRRLRNLSPEERFKASYLVDAESGCWIWMGSPRGRGYGRIKVDGVAFPAHRYSWILNYGDIPAGLYVCHRCDNPPCVNPKHLFLGTHQDNMDDCKRKGRTRGGTGTPARGSAHVKSKLTDEQVLQIRQDDRPQRKLAAIFGVSQSLVSKIQRNEVWRHL